MDFDIRPVKRPDPSVETSSDSSPAPKPTPQPETFHTPEEVAAHDDVHAPATLTDHPAEETHEAAADNGSWFSRLKNRVHPHWPPKKREWIASVVIVLVCGSIIGFVLTHTGSKPVANAARPAPTKPKAPPKPTTVPSTLSGLPVDPSINKLPVTGVMIENSPQARPQSGLGQASVVFEAIAEGGVTRFLALYQDSSPSNVGPVRSARPYYEQWALGFDAAYAHVGGSPDGLADIKAWNVKDLDEFHNAGSYHRISSRAAPHNVYTAISTLNQLETSKGYTTSTFTGFARKADSPAKVPTAKSINVILSGPTYNAHYDYIAATNSYNRSEGGAPQFDANTNAVISPKVVVVLVMPYSLGALDSSGAYYSEYNTLGSGPAYVFQDGTVTTGQWSKASNATQFTFTDASGKPLKLNTGQTWLTAVGAQKDVNFTP